MDPWEKKKWLVVLALVFVCVGGSIWQERKALPEGPEPQAVVQQEKATKEKPPGSPSTSAGRSRNRGSTRCRPASASRRHWQKRGV